MVQAMDHEAVDGTSDGSRSSRRRYGSGSCRSEGAMDGASDGRSNGWYKLWISSRTNVQAMDQGAVERYIDGASDGRSDSWCKLLITKQSMVQAMDQEAVEASIDVTGRKHMMMIG